MLDTAIFTAHTYKPYYEFWLGQLARFNTGFCFRQDNHKNDRDDGLYDEFQILLEKSLSTSINEKLKGNDTGVFIMVLSALVLMMKRYSSSENVILHTPLLGTDADKIYYAKVPLCFNVDESAQVKTYLNNIKSLVRQTYSYQNFPLDILDTKHGDELFSSNVLISFAGIHAAPESQAYDLIVSVSNLFGSLSLNIQYKRQLYSGDFAINAVRHLNCILGSFITSTGRLSEIEMLSFEERHQVVNLFNDTFTPFAEEKTITKLFDDQVRLSPHAVAVVFEDCHLTYQELAQKSDQLGCYLRMVYKIKADDLIGLMVSRTEKLVIAIIAILKSGGAYLPIDPAYPLARQEYLVEDSNIQLLITDLNDIESISFKKLLHIDNQDIWKTDICDFKPANNPNDLIYSIYTSGSTGVPKGVLVEHRSVVNLTHWLSELIYKNTTGPLRVMLTASVNFDASVQQLFGPIVNGSCLHIISEETRRDPGLYRQALLRNAIEVIDITPSFLQVLLDELTDHPIRQTVRYTLVGGEVLSKKIADHYLSTMGTDSKLVNVYGVTESTVNSTFLVSHSANYVSSIGKPISNTSIYILDTSENIMPIGVAGEIFIGGPGVSRGYLNRPELTGSVFTKNKFTQSGYLYKTGDLGKWSADGQLQFIGRKDQQIKLRGYRIEPGEISNTLLSYSGIDKAVVVPRRACDEETLLIAYIIGENLDLRDLHKYLRDRLPAYMIPDHFMVLENFPVTMSGKLDLDALPTPKTDADHRISDVLNASTVIQSKLMKIWVEILHKNGIGLQDNFFEIGGHSLKALQVLSRINREFKVKVSVTDFFKFPSIAKLSELIRDIPTGSFEVIHSIEEQEYYPISHGQKRLWILSHLEESQTAYNLFGAYIFNGPLNTVIFCSVIRELLERHEILRTGFLYINGEPKQRVNSISEIELPIQIFDLQHDKDRDSLVKHIINQEKSYSFNLTQAPLLRAVLICTQQNEHVFVLSFHHIVADGWSVNIIAKELFGLYSKRLRNKDSSLSAIKLQYRDYAVWHNKVSLMQRDYWYNTYQDRAIPKCSLPFDFSPHKGFSTRGQTIIHFLPEDLTTELTSFAVSQSVTLNNLLFAIYGILIAKWCRQHEIIVGLLVSNRNHVDVESMVGVFNNYLPILCNIDAQQNFDEYLTIADQNIIKAYENQDYPFDTLVSNFIKGRASSQNPFFSTLFNFHSQNDVNLNDATNVGSETFPVEVSPLAIEYDASELPLKVDLTIANNKIEIQAAYHTHLFRHETIRILMDQFEILIKAIIDSPHSKLGSFELSEAVKFERPIPNLDKPDVKSIKDVMIYSSFRIEPVREYMEYWAEQSGLVLRISVIDKNPLNPEIEWSGGLQPSHAYFFCLRFEDWIVPFMSDQEQEINLLKCFSKYKSCFIKHTQDLITAPIFVILFPPSSFFYGALTTSCLNTIHSQWELLLKEMSKVHVIRVEEIANLYSVGSFSSTIDNDVMAEECYAALGTYFVRQVYNTLNRSYKVIAIDSRMGVASNLNHLDTLTSEQNKPYLYGFLAKKEKEGFLLVVCNNCPDETWDSVSSFESISVTRNTIKSTGGSLKPSAQLKALACKLDLPLHNFIFLTNDQQQCEEIALNTPEVFALKLPINNAEHQDFLEHIWALDTPLVTS